MKRFSFSLERVLAWRRIEAKLRSAELTRMFQDQDELNGQRQQLHAQRQAARLLSDSSAVFIAEMHTLSAYQRRCHQLDVAMTQKGQILTARIVSQKGLVSQAERNVKLLEELRLAEQARWKAEAEQEQEEFASEAFLCRWNAGASETSTDLPVEQPVNRVRAELFKLLV